MPDHTLNCADARLQECIESALKERPEVAVPPRFAARVMAQLPPEQPERSFSPWAPVAGVLLFPVLGIVLWWRGDGFDVAQALLRWQALTAMAALETGIALAWVWRVARRQE
jgi:hypothetical protein